MSFHVQARELGFSTAQARALEQVAKTVARWPGALLVDAKGRGLLSTQLGRRINRRSRQAALLTATRTHLDGVREGGQVLSGLRSAYPELSVWVAPATAPKVGADAPDADSWGPAAGVLEAISPAGMSVRMQEEAETGDLLEVWSADPQAPFASVRAGVTSVDVDGPTKRYHLHMLDIGQRQMVELVEQMRRASGISRGDNGLTQGEAAAPVTPRFTWNNLEVVFPAKEEIEEHCRAWTHDFPFLRGVGAEIERGADGTVLRLAAQVPHGELCSCLHTDMKNLGSAAEAACDQLSQLLERYAASREPRRAH